MQCRGEIEEDEGLLWSAMVLEYALYMVREGNTFLKIEKNHLLRKLEQVSIANFSGTSRANISGQMKNFGLLIQKTASMGAW